MNSTNTCLTPIVDAFITAQESLKVVKQIVKNPSQYPQSVLAKMPNLFDSQVPRDRLNNSLKEIEDLFVLNLWATFERWLRDYLQDKGDNLNITTPKKLGSQLYDHFTNEVEYWKPENMLDILKEGIFFDSLQNKQLVGHAKQILNYRNWIAHGRNPKRLPKITNLVPSTAYRTLNTIIDLICRAELTELSQNT
jgi:hypothetical protein